MYQKLLNHSRQIRQLMENIFNNSINEHFDIKPPKFSHKNSHFLCKFFTVYQVCVGWLRGSMVERRSLAGKLYYPVLDL